MWKYNKNMKNTDIEMKVRMDIIKEQLSQLCKIYPNFEYVMLATMYDENKEFVGGTNSVRIIEPNDLDIYIDILNQKKANFKERARFKQYLTLDTFRVKCMDDSMDDSIKEIYEEKDSKEWVKTGEEYVVIDIFDSLIDSSLCFKLRHIGTSKEIVVPYPLEGFKSSRFIPAKKL